jgi:Tol biopolymer transport system component
MHNVRTRTFNSRNFASLPYYLFAYWLKSVSALLLCGIILGSTVSNAAVQLISTPDSPIASSSGNAGSHHAILSPDGNFVLFSSTADNLVLITNGASVPALFPSRWNVFLRNRTNVATTLISLNADATSGGNGDSFAAGVSTNGRYVLFESWASDLVANDTNNFSDVFIRDLASNTTARVSISTTGENPNGGSHGATFTPDGRYVTFVSGASNLVLNDTNGIEDIFVRDLQLGPTVLVSLGATSENFTRGSASPNITPDGRYVVFYSTATNLVPGVATAGEIYVRDLVGNTTTRASSYAATALYSILQNSNAVSYNHAISDDGKFVIYETSRASSLGLNPGIILRYGMDSDLTDIVHTNAKVAYSYPDQIRTLDISSDGRFIAFVANTNGSSGTTTCVQVWDGQTGFTLLASGDATNGVTPGTTCSSPIRCICSRWQCLST